MRRFTPNLWSPDLLAGSGSPIVFRRLQPYLMALFLVGMALAATLALQHLFVVRPPLFAFFVAIALAAWLEGRGPGYFAVAVSLPMALYFYAVTRPEHSVLGRDVLIFVFLACCAFAGGALHARRRKVQDTLQKTHQELITKAAELQSVNDALVAEIAERQRTEAALETTRSELVRAARLASMAEMAAAIAHEINQPLTAAVTNADTCLRWLDAPSPAVAEARDAARRAARDAERAAQVIARIRAMMRNAIVEPAEVSLRSCLDEVLSLLQAEIDRHRIALHTRIEPSLPAIRSDRVQMQQVFVNLITNAVESLSRTTGRPRHLWIDARRTAPDEIAIVVRDNGNGFQDGVLDKLFDSFVTTKPGGMGMGLSICRTIVEAHGGTLAAAPAAPDGAQFTVALPLKETRHD